MPNIVETLPLLHVNDALSLFAGRLGRNARHSHSVTVFLAGLYEPFSLRIDEGDWQSCRTAVLPAGVPYEFDMQGAPLAVLYVESDVARVQHLTRLLKSVHEEGGALIRCGGEISLLREIFEDRESLSWVGSALDNLLSFAAATSAPIDPWVRCALARLRDNYMDLGGVASVAAMSGLSPSRFQHVFSRDVGVPFRRYRAWCRMRAAIGAVLGGNNLTAASYEAGFADQAHFSRDFRRLFGASANPSLCQGQAPAEYPYPRLRILRLLALMRARMLCYII